MIDPFEKTAKQWLAAQQIIAAELAEILSIPDVRCHEENAAAIIARLASHDPPILLTFAYEVKEDGPPMSTERFNELLNGPLSHPLIPFRISRLSLALASVLAETGAEGAAALERHCEAR